MKSTVVSQNFFLLSKGYNAGKPLEDPCPNCFIVTPDDQLDKESLFWICYSLWKSGKYLPHLCGSVVPFLHINDIRYEIQKAIEVMNDDRKSFDHSVTQLQKLIHTEKLLMAQMKMITEMKTSIARRLLTEKK